MQITIDEIIMIPPLVIDLVDSFRTWHSRCQRLYVFRRHQFVAISIKNVKRRTHLNIRHFYRQRPIPPIYLHSFYAILQFEIWSLMNLIFSLFQTGILQATAGRKIQFKIEKKYSSSNLIFRTVELQKSSADRQEDCLRLAFLPPK